MMKSVRLPGMILLFFVMHGIPAATAQVGTPDSEQLPAAMVAKIEHVKEVMLAMTRQMHGIVSGIETVEDVQKADEEIGRIFDDLVEHMREALKNPEVLNVIEQEVENDPEMKEWSQKMDAAMEQLKADHPEAAAELEKVMQKHAMKLMALVGEAMQNMSPEDMQNFVEDSENEAQPDSKSTEESGAE